MAKVRGTKVCTARSSRIGDYDIQRTIERESGYLAKQGKIVVNTQMGQIQTTPSGDQTCLITLTWEADDNDPQYKAAAAASASAGCYVATAVYGSYDCPQVWTLRRYRDYTLAETWYGRLFIKTYYAISPTLVKWFGKTKWFKNMWQKKLDSMVKKLQSEGVESTPYNDRVF